MKRTAPEKPPETKPPSPTPWKADGPAAIRDAEGNLIGFIAILPDEASLDFNEIIAKRIANRDLIIRRVNEGEGLEKALAETKAKLDDLEARHYTKMCCEKVGEDDL